MKKKLIGRTELWIWLFLIAVSCDNGDEPTPIEITVSPLQVIIAENPQNGDLLGELTAATNRGTLTFSLSDENPIGAMAIDGSTGEITIADASLFDFEQHPTISAIGNVTVGDETGTANITINLTDVDESTLSAQNFSMSIDENPTNGQVLGTVSATADAASTIAYSITSQTPNGALAINTVSGELTVADSTLFDYETNTSITAVIRVSTNTRLIDVTATITLNDLNEATISANPFFTEVDENLANGTVIGKVDASVTSGPGTLTYSILSQSINGAVSINANGELIVANTEGFNFEARAQVSGIYRAAIGDNGADAGFRIRLNDIDEHVVNAEDFGVSIDENPTPNQFIGNVGDGVSVSGQAGTVTFSLVSQSISGAVRIDDLGRMFVDNTTNFDYEAQTQITGVFRAEVAGSASPTGSATANFTISINDKFTWSKSVFAGQIGTISDTDGPRTSARFRGPRGMAFDASGNLFIADYGNHRIRKIDNSGNVTTYAGTTQGYQGGIVAKFNFPNDVDVDMTGNVWVSEERNQSVRYITPSGSTVLPRNRGLGFVPNGLAVQGNFIYITFNHGIRRFNISTERLDGYVVGSETPSFQDGTGNQAGFNDPRGIDINNLGELFVADYENRRIRRVGTGNATFTYPGAYFQVTDVEVAPDGNIYAVESGNRRVRIVTLTTQGAFDEILVDGFGSPQGIAIHPTTGEIYVSDAGNHVIYKLEKVEE